MRNSLMENMVPAEIIVGIREAITTEIPPKNHARILKAFLRGQPTSEIVQSFPVIPVGNKLEILLKILAGIAPAAKIF